MRVTITGMRALRTISVILATSSMFGCSADSASDGSEPLPVGTSSGGGTDGSGGAGGAGGSQSTASSMSTSTSSSMGSGAGPTGPCDGEGPELVTAASRTRFLLRGTLLLPGGPLEGELLIDGNEIACAAASCASNPAASGATVIDTNGVIAPGLIDGHNHILFDIFDTDDWIPDPVTYDDKPAYTYHSEWKEEEPYGALVDTKQYLNGEGFNGCLDAGVACTSGTSCCSLKCTGGTCEPEVFVGCEMLKYGETKALVAGTTSVVGSPGGAARKCFSSVARSLDIAQNDLPDDFIQAATIFPTTSAADGVCENLASGDTTAYVIHIAEGIDGTDARGREEFDDLGAVTTVDGCLYDPRTTLVHGTALDQARLELAADNGMNIVWSPRSNVFLYGNGTDLTKTTDIPAALALGIEVAIAPDWSIGGSQNMLDELRFADYVDNSIWNDLLTPRQLFEMATSTAAKVLGVAPYIGTLEVGKRADVSVFLPIASDPYASILAATPKEVTLVFVDGRLLYGDKGFEQVAPENATCEDFDGCCRAKMLCIAETDGAPADKLEQTLAQIQTILNDAISDYDALDVTQWKFAPIAPVVKCGP
jgi:5-methylthioadenosine/S-adenosylhomocysteine deaminase